MEEPPRCHGQPTLATVWTGPRGCRVPAPSRLGRATFSRCGCADRKGVSGRRRPGDVDLDIRAGEVHGLVGENGAGKSTLLKIITGAEPPTEGTIELFGESVELNDPLSARKHGVTAVYQELTVIPTSARWRMSS